jgi:hypothetical protein
VLDRRSRWSASSFNFYDADRFRSANSFKIFKLWLQIARCSLITFRLSAGKSFEAKTVQSRLIDSRTLSIFHLSSCSRVLIVSRLGANLYQLLRFLVPFVHFETLLSSYDLALDTAHFSDRKFGDLLSNFGDAPFLHNSKVAIALTRPSVA